MSEFCPGSGKGTKLNGQGPTRVCVSCFKLFAPLLFTAPDHYAELPW